LSGVNCYKFDLYSAQYAATILCTMLLNKTGELL